MEELSRYAKFSIPFITALFFIVGCGGGGGGGKSTSNNPPPPNTVTQSQVPTGNCAQVLDQDITTPTRLVNTESTCDYSLADHIEVRASLTIDPGVVIVAKQGTGISVDGGDIHALGTEKQRIIFQGETNSAGFWSGIRYYSGRESEFHYVDIKDAGQICHTMFCADAALIVEKTELSLTHSTISNSYSNGLVIFKGAKFNQFAYNKFFGNTALGIQAHVNHVPSLDAESDYSGEDTPNGTPFVMVNGEQEDGAVFRWKKLNTPYLIPHEFTISGGLTIIEPGTTLLFGYQAYLSVEGNGELNAVGTADQPILLKGLDEQPGYWVGIEINESWSERNEFSHVQIQHAGETQSLIAQFSALYMRASILRLNNTTISKNSGAGISCTEGTYFIPYPKITLGENVILSENDINSIDEDCELENVP